MKNLPAYFLLLLFVVAIGKPVYPILGYWMNKDFIVQNLCVQKDMEVNECQGQCHLQEEVSKSQEDKQADNGASKLPKIELDYYYSIDFHWQPSQTREAEILLLFSFYKNVFFLKFNQTGCFQPPEYV